MFMLEVKKIIISLNIVSFLLFCNSFADDNKTKTSKKNIDGAIMYSLKGGKYTSYFINKQNKKGFSTYGRKPTLNEIKAWNTDVMPDGTGLPIGKGTVEDGDELYHEKCAMCHGDFGAGGKGYPTLVGGQGSLKNQLLLEGTEGPRKTIGSYWPYASTLFWYIKTAMPFTNPKSLTDDEVYAITAYLLSVNEIKVAGEEIDDEFELNNENFKDIQMNNKDGFYPVHPSRNDLKEIRKPLVQGERCMSNCKQPKPVSIKNEIKGFDPEISTQKSLPKEKESNTKVKVDSKIKKIYESNCHACHGNKAIGAPLFGNKEEWTKVLSKGIENIYNNSINGINAMPPKGGRVYLSDDEFKKIVDYMINSSK